MASTSQLRQWWSAYRCEPAKYAPVSFPGPSGPNQWRLSVAQPSKALWMAFADVMRQHNYLFRESEGGTYNCRKIAGSDNWSLHAYAIALDLNPSRNKYGQCGTNQPATFRNDILAITIEGQRAFTWGGDWRPCSKADPMHWQINVSPDTAEKYDYHSGGIGMYERLEIGDTGDQVQYVQITMLAASSMLDDPNLSPGDTDGIYGPKTSAAVLACRKYVGSNATSGDVLTEHAWEQIVRVHAMGAAVREGSGGGLTEAQVKSLIADHAKAKASSSVHPHGHDEGKTGGPI